MKWLQGDFWSEVIGQQKFSEIGSAANFER